MRYCTEPSAVKETFISITEQAQRPGLSLSEAPLHRLTELVAVLANVSIQEHF